MIQGPNLGFIIQARMGSTRLPGKVLKPLAGKPIIDWIVDRVRLCRSRGRIVVATSDLSQDDRLWRHLFDQGVDVFRGSESDVLDRYNACARKYGFDQIVRLTGDNPFVDPEEVDRLISYHVAKNLDYSTLYPELGCGLPIGLGGEIFSIETLAISSRVGLAPHHREHVNEYVLENLQMFRHGVPEVPNAKCAAGLSFTVDTPSDFSRAERLALSYMATHADDRSIKTEWLIHMSESQLTQG